MLKKRFATIQILPGLVGIVLIVVSYVVFSGRLILSLERIDGIADSGEFAPFCPTQSEDKAALQLAHRNLRLGRDNLYYPFRTASDLDHPIRSFLEKLAPRDNANQISNLPLESLGSLFKGREEFIDDHGVYLSC